MATTNSCSLELPENQFVHCTTCEDFDLCQPCFARDIHGHHPKHGFVPAVPGTLMPDHITVKMAPGRNQMHHAICDGCDKVSQPEHTLRTLDLPTNTPQYITGVRHKCLDCPDWDYCANCISSAHLRRVGEISMPSWSSSRKA